MGKLKRSGLWMIAAGLCCVIAALALFFYNMWDDARAGIAVTAERELVIAAVLPDASALSGYSSEHAIPFLPEEKEEEKLYYREMSEQEINGVTYVAVLSIPDLKLELPVRSEWSYEALNKSPCRYVGSAWMDDLVICAHNYSQHFGRLKDLEEDSEVLLVDMDGNLFRYRVALIETLLPTDIEKMIDSDYDLSLFTCTLGGQTRVTVRCQRSAE